VKAREIFIYPSHLQSLLGRVDGLREARASVGRRDGREEITLELLADDPAKQGALEEPITMAFRALTRLRPDVLRWVASADSFGIKGLLEDRKDS
jgi:hypothetical protein